MYGIPFLPRMPLAIRSQDDTQPFVTESFGQGSPDTPSHTQPTNSSVSPAPGSSSYASTPNVEHLRPLRSAAFLQAPTDNTPSLAYLHVLYEVVSAYATFRKGKDETLKPELVAFNDLRVLAMARGMQPGGLPWHLAAVRVMETALSAVNAGD